MLCGLSVSDCYCTWIADTEWSRFANEVRFQAATVVDARHIRGPRTPPEQKQTMQKKEHVDQQDP